MKKGALVWAWDLDRDKAIIGEYESENSKWGKIFYTVSGIPFRNIKEISSKKLIELYKELKCNL